MSEMMTFPDTWEEFEKSYGFTDNEEVYTNGARLIPSFRAKQWIDHLSSEEPQKWIPVSERLPEDLEEVIITWVNHDPESYYAFTKNLPFTGVAVYHRGKWYWYSSICTDVLAEYGRNDNDKMDDAIEVVAWMPLPDPWEGEEE